MKEYIERAALKRELAPYEENDFSQQMDVILAIVDAQPTADVVEVRHAHWEFPVFTDSDDGLDPRVKCSECGGIEAAFARWKYCPNCGARIDKEANHEISKP